MTSSRNPPVGERLQKVLARAGVASRRQVEEMVREGRITVNGSLAEIGQRVDLAVDAVKVDGRRVFEPSGERRYVLLNKPSGVMSTRQDPEGRTTVLELLPVGMRKGLYPVGRLDYDTEGLLILTDDGDFAQQVAHPRYGCVKTYEAKVKGRPESAAIDRLRTGVSLYGKTVVPVSIEPRVVAHGPRHSVNNSWWTVRLGEGLTRQVREMFFRIGHPVARLRRVAIGPIADPHLASGTWRELTEKEVEALRSAPGSQAQRKAKKSRDGAKGRGPAKGNRRTATASKGARPKGRGQSGGKPSGRPPRGGKTSGKRSPSRSSTTKRGPKRGGRG